MLSGKQEADLRDIIRIGFQTGELHVYTLPGKLLQWLAPRWPRKIDVDDHDHVASILKEVRQNVIDAAEKASKEAERARSVEAEAKRQAEQEAAAAKGELRVAFEAVTEQLWAAFEKRIRFIEGQARQEVLDAAESAKQQAVNEEADAARAAEQAAERVKTATAAAQAAEQGLELAKNRRRRKEVDRAEVAELQEV